MENRAHALAAGLFILFLGIAGAVSAWWLSDRSAETRDYALVATKSVTGLNKQAQVRYRGIRSGKVLDIELDPDDRRQILVTIRIDADVPVTRTTTAQLNYQGLTGLAYVQLDDTGESAELLAEQEGKLPRIPLKASQIEALGDTATEMAREARATLERVNALLDQKNIERIGRTLANLEQLTADADAAVRDLPAVLAQIRQVLNDDNMKRLQATLANLEKTSAEGVTLAGDVHQLVVNLQRLSQRIEALSGEAGVEVVGNTLPRIGQLVQEMTSNSRQLKRILSDLESAPQALIFGKGRGRPGPGEAGFAPGTP